MQATLYDIFSIMGANEQQAQFLLENFSKAAVAGQVDIQAAGRTTMELMNAYKIPISDVNKVLDFQFKMVKEGGGNYKEFTDAIGLSVPAAVAAGQSYTELGGDIAFLTRQGMTASSATAAVGRAMELLTKPDTIKNLVRFRLAASSTWRFLTSNSSTRWLTVSLTMPDR
jgi:TP901 family phage tail tape measure protein